LRRVPIDKREGNKHIASGFYPIPHIGANPHYKCGARLLTHKNSTKKTV
jgi:hypothetical protein